MRSWLIISVLCCVQGPALAMRTADDILHKGDPAQQGQAIADELRQRNHGYRDFLGDVEMVLEDASGGQSRRRFTVKALERESAATGDRSLILFESPADVKGTAVLSHGDAAGEDEQWLYLPSSKRTKRISSANRGGSFVGSEFSFEDLTGSDERKHVWTYRTIQPCGAEKCLVVDTVPRDPNSAYSRRVLQIDAAEFRLRSVEFFDRHGARLKTLTYDDYQKLEGGYWRARSWTMQNHQTQRRTSLHFLSMRVKSGLSASDFSAGKLGN